MLNPVIRIVLLFFLFVAIGGCQQETDIYQNCNCKNTISRTCVIYEQTYCADPWGQNNEGDEKLVNNLIVYFDNIGITLFDVGIGEGGIRQDCYACHCKSGRRFCAKVRNRDLNTVKEYGFTEK